MSKAMDEIKNCITYNDKLYHAIPLTVIFAHLELVTFPFLIELASDKHVVINLPAEAIKNSLDNYSVKGLREIYLSQEDYINFLRLIKEKTQQALKLAKSKSESNTVNLFLNTFLDMSNMASDALNKFGMNQFTLDMSKGVASTLVESMESIPEIFNLLQNFKLRGKIPLAKEICTAYLVSSCLELLPWGAGRVKEKVVLGILLADATLSRSDFQFIEKYHGRPEMLPERIRQHPFEVLKKLTNLAGIERETILVIEQHHELPSGKGFPRGLSGTNINQLAAVSIICRSFIDELFNSNFSSEQKDPIFQRVFERFYSGNFRLICNALFKVLNPEAHVEGF